MKIFNGKVRKYEIHQYIRCLHPFEAKKTAKTITNKLTFIHVFKGELYNAIQFTSHDISQIQENVKKGLGLSTQCQKSHSKPTKATFNTKHL